MFRISTLIVMGAFMLTSPIFSHGQSGNTWTEKADFPLNRERAVGFSVANLGYVCAGEGANDIVHNDLWAFDPASNSWSQKADLPGSVRRNAIAFSIGNLGYVGTGMDNVNSAVGITLNDFWAYDPTNNSWNQKANYPGGGGNGVYFATSFSLNNVGYICAGKVGPSDYKSDLWAYDPGTDAWTQKTDFPGGIRYKLTSFTAFDLAYVGLGVDLDVYRKDIWAYNPINDDWQQRADFAGGDIASVATFTIDNQPFVCTGEDGGLSDDLFEYDPAGDYWHLRSNLPGEERRYAIAFTIGGKAYLGTGDGYSGKKKSFYEYAPPPPISVPEYTVSIKVYPNPTADILHINTLEKISSISLFGLNGQLLKKADPSFTQINLSEFGPGYYLVQITTQNGALITKKIIRS